MALRERLIYAIDVVTDGAKTGFAGFKSSVAEAEGTVGKFKAGASSAFATVQANAGLLAVSAGTALVAFGAKAVLAFEEGALAAGKFSDASGLATEDASRWQEVAKDFGVNAESFAGTFVRLERAIASNSPAVKQLGIETKKTTDGQADANATMLDAIRRLGEVRDPIEKADLAAKLFGRNFKDSAEIVMGNADDIKKRLGEVSDAQVFDPEEVKKARELRDAVENVKDKFQALTLQLGGALAPAITNVADSLTELVDISEKLHLDKALEFGTKVTALNAVDKLVGKIKDLFGSTKSAADANKELSDSYVSVASSAGLARGAAADGAKEAADEVAKYGDRLTQFHAKVDLATTAIEMKADADKKAADADKKAADAADRHTEAVDGVTRALEAQTDAAVNLVGGDIAVRNAQRDAAEAAKNLNDVLDDQSTTFGEAGAAVDAAAQSQIDAANAAANYRAQQMEANGEAITAKVQAQLFKEELQKLVGQLDGPLAAALQTYIDSLDSLDGRNVRTTITLTTAGRVGDTTADPRVKGKRAAGGSTMAGGLYEVTENGSEILEENGRRYLMAGANGNVVPLNGKSGSAGATVHNHYHGVLDSRMVEQIRRQTERATRGRL